MTYDAFFARHRADFIARNWDRLRFDYACPVAVYFGPRVVVMRTPQALVEGMEAFCNALRRAEVRRTSLTVDAISLPRKGRQAVWVSWGLRSPADEDLGVARTIYYFALPPGRAPVIEMVSYEHLPHAALADALVEEMSAA